MNMKFLSAAILAAALPVMSQAATISSTENVNDYNYTSFSIKSGDSNVTTWEVGSQAYAISEVAFTINGVGASSNFVYVTVTAPTGHSNTWALNTSKTTGEIILPGFTATSSFAISFAYDAAGTRPLPVTYTFNATPIPVPAAGALLVSALAGLGFAKRRRNKA